MFAFYFQQQEAMRLDQQARVADSLQSVNCQRGGRVQSGNKINGNDVQTLVVTVL